MINRMTLEFEVNSQTVRRIDNLRPASGSINYLYAHFNFSGDWDGLTKKAKFVWNETTIVYAYLDSKNECKVPFEVIKPSQFYVSLIGENENGEYVKVTTDRATSVHIADSGSMEGSETAIRFIYSDTLDVQKNYDEVNLDVKNIYPVTAKFNTNTGYLSFYGRKYINENDEEIEPLLFNVDLPTEKVIDSIQYDNETKNLIFNLEDKTQRFVYIGSLLTDYLTNSQIELMLNNLKQDIKKVIPDDASETNKLATNYYVERNGGKINSITLNGVEQVIDENKNVELKTITTDDNVTTEEETYGYEIREITISRITNSFYDLVNFNLGGNIDFSKPFKIVFDSGEYISFMCNTLYDETIVNKKMYHQHPIYCFNDDQIYEFDPDTIDGYCLASNETYNYVDFNYNEIVKKIHISLVDGLLVKLFYHPLTSASPMIHMEM